MNFLDIAIYVILAGILVISIIIENIFFDINPTLWFVGGLMALICGMFEIGIVSCTESLIAFGISIVFSVLLYSKLSKMMGGGIIKGFWMCAIFLGRYTIILVVTYFIVMYIAKKLFYCMKKDIIPGDTVKKGMPYVTISALITVVITFLF